MSGGYIGTGAADRDPVVGNDTVTTSKIADDAVTAAKIAADAVGASEIAADAVGASELANDAVDTNAVADNAITLAKMAGITRASIIVGDASGDPSALAKGTSEQVLRVNTAGTDLEYADAVGGAAWALKTGNYTAVAGDGVMVDTSSSSITITLPISSGPPALGDFVRILDLVNNLLDLPLKKS